VTTAEPEKLVLRRVLPFAPLAAIGAFALGAAVGGLDVGWSGTLGIAVVAVNAVAAGISLAWASKISPTAMYAVGLGGFVVRLVLFFLLLIGLDGLAWFSPIAFALAFMVGTLAVLVFEMKILSGRKLQSDLWYFREPTS
jgi:hypothetical protein